MGNLPTTNLPRKLQLKLCLLGSVNLEKRLQLRLKDSELKLLQFDKYNAPAHMVAHRAYVVDMLNKDEVLEVIEKEKPTYILPEVEAISIDALFEAEKRRNSHVIPEC